jgi:error-prone DNA polymerase
MIYTELQVTTNFSFLRGGSHPEELVGHAIELGYKCIAITDRNTLAGIVRAHAAAKGKDFRIIPACRLDLLDGPSLLAYPTGREAYSRLSALLTEGNLRTEKGKCDLYKADVYRNAQGIKFIAVPPSSLNESFDFDLSFARNLREYREVFGTNLYLSAIRSYQGDDMKKLYRLDQLSQRFNIPLVATNDVHYHNLQRRELQDVLTCVREKCTIYNAGYRLHENAERYLKPAAEMQRLFLKFPEAVRRTQEIADACQFSLNSLKYVYPDELTTEGRTPLEELEYLIDQKTSEKYKDGVPEKIASAITHELKFIKTMDYAPIFLQFTILSALHGSKIYCARVGVQLLIRQYATVWALLP